MVLLSTTPDHDMAKNTSWLDAKIASDLKSNPLARRSRSGLNHLGFSYEVCSISTGFGGDFACDLLAF